MANVATGFDILGFALSVVGDRVTVRRAPEPGVRITEVVAAPGAEGLAGVEQITLDPARNTAGVPLLRLLEKLRPGYGFVMRIEKGIPLGSGMGGSAASAVGAVVAANALLERPLRREELLDFALEGEAVASGSRHADNIAPCLWGGLTLSWPGENPDVVRLPYPTGLLCALVNPAMRLDTREARAVLKPDLPLKTHILQSARLAALVAGCCLSDVGLLRKGLDDVVIEPQRARLIPGFAAVKRAALECGALGCSLSGAGPSVFALAEDSATASRARDAMIEAFRTSGKLEARGWVSPISAAGSEVQ